MCPGWSSVITQVGKQGCRDFNKSSSSLHITGPPAFLLREAPNPGCVLVYSWEAFSLRCLSPWFCEPRLVYIRTNHRLPPFVMGSEGEVAWCDPGHIPHHCAGLLQARERNGNLSTTYRKINSEGTTSRGWCFILPKMLCKKYSPFSKFSHVCALFYVYIWVSQVSPVASVTFASTNPFIFPF